MKDLGDVYENFELGLNYFNKVSVSWLLENDLLGESIKFKLVLQIRSLSLQIS